jgi:hypothetical protein
MPFPAIFKKSDDFKEFLLTKLINAGNYTPCISHTNSLLERAAMSAPGFASKISRTRSTLLEDIINDS